MTFRVRSSVILASALLALSASAAIAEETKQKKAEPNSAAKAGAKSDLIRAAEAAEARRKAVEAGLVDKDAPSSPTPSPLAQAAAAARASRAQRDETSAFTTADLERMFGGGEIGGVYQGGDAAPPAQDGAEPAPSSGGPAARAGDPLALMQMQQAQAAQQREQAAQAQAEVQQLENRIQALERRKIAIANPLLARPEVAKEEGNEDWDELDNNERLQRTEAELADLRAKLAEARKKAGGS